MGFVVRIGSARNFCRVLEAAPTDWKGVLLFDERGRF